MLLETSFGFKMWTLVQEGLDFYQLDVVNRAEKEEMCSFSGLCCWWIGG